MADEGGDGRSSRSGRCSRGLIQIPGVTDVLESFLDPVFAASPIASAVHVSTTDAYIGMAVGGLCSLLGIGAAFYLYMVAPGSTLRLRDRFHRTHDFLFNRWYFDELIDALVYRPVVAIGRFANNTFERVVDPGHRPGDQRRRSAASARSSGPPSRASSASTPCS